MLLFQGEAGPRGPPGSTGVPVSSGPRNAFKWPYLFVFLWLIWLMSFFFFFLSRYILYLLHSCSGSQWWPGTPRRCWRARTNGGKFCFPHLLHFTHKTSLSFRCCWSWVWIWTCLSAGWAGSSRTRRSSRKTRSWRESNKHDPGRPYESLFVLLFIFHLALFDICINSFITISID